ncbi:putative leucine-rich repeat domain, L domain-containing protein [Rosa chinensis]|uniref:Putative leucine-rich repeat domain, L domain-containing protein n=1 Tax=Rosa chinensis TaxID=74649 RepID=A0A2P6RC27_ROSCH|nr:putative leucine-rich repeat domain, L domain-containing protein [Rosa chinensis]
MPCEVRLKLVNALDRFLLSRGYNEMRKFTLVWEGHHEDEVEEPPCFCVNESFRMITWIQNALRCNVEKLFIDMTFYDRDGELLAFPSCVFNCASLRSLVVEMSFTVVKTPSFTFSSNLETLALSDVDIADEGFFKWISCSCKLLKELRLAGLNGIDNITIESLSLEKFSYIHFEVYETCRINISGEKLEEIHINCSRVN